MVKKVEKHIDIVLCILCKWVLHADAYVYTHAHPRVCANTHPHMYMWTCTDKYTHILITDMYIEVRMQTYTQKYTRGHLHKSIDAHVQLCARTHIR